MSAPTKWTPGPWVWRGNTDSEIYLCALDGDRTFVMKFGRKGMHGGQPLFPHDGGMVPAVDLAVHEQPYRNDIVGIANANAHLIAAAPELYDLLDRVLDIIDDERLASSWQWLTDEIKPALARARGEVSP